MADGISKPVRLDVRDFSPLQVARLAYAPALPAALVPGAATALAAAEPTVARAASEMAALRSWFPRTLGQPLVNVVSDAGAKRVKSAPLRVGVVFAGRQAPGGHCVVSGLFDFLAGAAPIAGHAARA
jgi:pyrophosphate--fructose-6-phosphate 1-phosphotransferase